MMTLIVANIMNMKIVMMIQIAMNQTQNQIMVVAVHQVVVVQVVHVAVLMEQDVIMEVGYIFLSAVMMDIVMATFQEVV